MLIVRIQEMKVLNPRTWTYFSRATDSQVALQRTLKKYFGNRARFDAKEQDWRKARLSDVLYAFYGWVTVLEDKVTGLVLVEVIDEKLNKKRKR